MNNRGRSFLCLSSILALALLPTLADAQFDHMRCFKIKDSAKFEAQALLTAVQTQFGLDESCQIKGKGKMFCVPVQKTVTGFFDKSKDGIPQVALNGQELDYDSICYKVKCPKRDIAPELVTDQFGSRTVEKFKSSLLCTPAIKGLPSATTSTTTTTNGNPTTTTTTTTQTPGCSDGTTQPCGSNVGECSAGTRTCANGAFGACLGLVGPTAETCDGLDNDCDGVADDGFDLTSDSNNCGSCGSACLGAAICIDSTCSDVCSQINVVCSLGAECVNLPDGGFECQCQSGFTDCGNGLCADLNTDSSNCGACGNACPSGAVCSNGACDLCPIIQCAVGHTCENNTCVPLPCQSGETDCGNGACADLSTDENNCGACGNACSQGDVCANGSCVTPACDFLQQNCPGGLACYPDGACDGNTAGTCATPGAGQQGAVCSADTDCAAGFTCIALGGGLNQCVELCSIGQGSTCGAGGCTATGCSGLDICF